MPFSTPTPLTPLKPIPYHQVGPEYYTFSVMGAVHVEEGDKEGAFMKLGEWMR
jgi:hypothetical protein